MASVDTARSPVGCGATLACAQADCHPEWIGDGYCDEACFNAKCKWDKRDCLEKGEKPCADDFVAQTIRNTNHADIPQLTTLDIG